MKISLSTLKEKKMKLLIWVKCMFEFQHFANSLFLTTAFEPDFMLHLVALYYKEMVIKGGSSPLKPCVARGGSSLQDLSYILLVVSGYFYCAFSNIGSLVAKVRELDVGDFCGFFHAASTSCCIGACSLIWKMNLKKRKQNGFFVYMANAM